MVAGIIVGLIGLVLAGFVAFLVAGPFLAGRYAKPDERRRENRHKFRRQAGASGRR